VTGQIGSTVAVEGEARAQAIVRAHRGDRDGGHIANGDAGSTGLSNGPHWQTVADERKQPRSEDARDGPRRRKSSSSSSRSSSSGGRGGGGGGGGGSGGGGAINPLARALLEEDGAADGAEGADARGGLAAAEEAPHRREVPAVRQVVPAPRAARRRWDD
jgi:hypothetical protein